MDKKLQNKVLKVALEAAEVGGRMTLKYFRKLKSVSIKEGAGLVSEADHASEEAIMKVIRKTFPTHKMLGEEGGYSGSGASEDGLWVVDPLDGTTNYVHGFPFFCVSIGFEFNGIVEVGVVFAPLLKYLFSAVRGGGASLNGKPINVSTTEQVEESLLATGFSYQKNKILESELYHFKKFAEKARGVRRAGSAALDMCMVASGVFDGFWERQLAPWDTAAGSLLVTEAGGVVSDYSGQPFHFSKDTVVACNRPLHATLIDILRNN